MLRAMLSASESAKRLAILAIVAFVAANLLFYVLSSGYFESHRQIIPGEAATSAFSPAQITTIRLSFALFTGVVSIASVLAGVWARVVGHVIPALLGVLYIIAGFAAALHGEVTLALPITLFVTGGLMPVLAHFSFRDRSRGAWAFLL